MLPCSQLWVYSRRLPFLLQHPFLKILTQHLWKNRKVAIELYIQRNSKNIVF
uniref:Uncharacterized protein n=1 Tax=Heterorhabditis bacteriophora TaxID=37862 RepID=A0A1I7WWM8_HETBA